MHLSPSRWAAAVLVGLLVSVAAPQVARADEAPKAAADDPTEAPEASPTGAGDPVEASPAPHASAACTDAIDPARDDWHGARSSWTRARPRCVRASDPTFRVEPLLSDADIEQQELSNGAGQLAISQGIHGVGLGLEICALAGCRRDRQWGAVAIATSMLGVGSVILGTRGRLDPRMSIAMRYGNLWGTLGAYSLFGATSRFYDESSSASGNRRALIGALIAGQFGGLALGGLAWRGLRFSEADADAAFGGGVWASGLAMLVMAPLMSGSESDLRIFHGTLFAVGHLGLIGGYTLSQHAHLSRRRIWLIQLGGVLGGAVGTAVPFLVDGGSRNLVAPFYSAAGGALGGMVIAALLTRRLDGPPVAVDVGLLPARGGAVATLGGRWR